MLIIYPKEIHLNYFLVQLKKVESRGIMYQRPLHCFDQKGCDILECDKIGRNLSSESFTLIEVSYIIGIIIIKII